MSGGERENCRSRQELSNAYLVAKIGVDTAENELKKMRFGGKIRFQQVSSQKFRILQTFLTQKIEILRSEICAKVCIV